MMIVAAAGITWSLMGIMLYWAHQDSSLRPAVRRIAPPAASSLGMMPAE